MSDTQCPRSHSPLPRSDCRAERGAGPGGGEVLSMLTLAVYAEAPLGGLNEMIYTYPTSHRAVCAAVGQLLTQN